MSRFGLPEDAVARIRGVLARHPGIVRAVLYGSRAKGDFRPGSDIDLTFFGEGLSLRELHAIATELDDLLLPWQFDLSVFETLTHETLREHIARVGVEFYRRSADHEAGT